MWNRNGYKDRMKLLTLISFFLKLIKTPKRENIQTVIRKITGFGRSTKHGKTKLAWQRYHCSAISKVKTSDNVIYFYFYSTLGWCLILIVTVLYLSGWSVRSFILLLSSNSLLPLILPFSFFFFFSFLFYFSFRFFSTYYWYSLYLHLSSL